MKRKFLIAALAMAAAVAGCGHMMGSESGGWETLFDGKTIDNFDRVGDANWRLENGMAVADRGQGFLLTRKEYGDFVFRAEFYAEPDTNSGIFIRCSNRKTIDSKDCYEVNIWDTRPGKEYATGAIVDVAKVNPVPKAGGRWNTYEITAKGDTMTVMLNGVKTSEGRDAKHAKGPIGLQRFNGNDKTNPVAIKFRKVEIKSL
jgi:3-keto-disaccharide hydrolase